MLNHPEAPILIIDDEDIVLKYTISVLKKGGITNTLSCSDPRNAADIVKNKPVSLILLDLIMPWIPGEELLDFFHEKYPEIPVIVITSSSDARTAVKAMKLGAVDFMIKRVEENRLITGVQKALEMRELREEIFDLKESIDTGRLNHPEIFTNIITSNKKMLKQFIKLEITAKGSQTILITGETGTGKELIANAIHKLSGRSGDLISINVAGINDDMFSDTLFGHKKGSFTSADKQRSGLIEKAAGGSLFLDEIGDLSQASQIKLLRVLENHEYYPIGSDTPHQSSTRIIAATNSNLRNSVDIGKFRKDLFFRLYMNRINLPPLRDRIEDLPILFRYFIKEASASMNKPTPQLPAKLCETLSAYSFPGNIRELRSLIWNAIEMQQGNRFPDEIILEYLENSPDWKEPLYKTGSCRINSEVFFGQTLPTIKQASEQLISEALSRCNGNQSNAAKLLGISQQALSSRLKRMHLQDNL